MSDTGHLKCPRCGRELTISAPEGLCPACLASLNFATETNISGADIAETLTPLAPAELAPYFPQLEILECLGRGGMGVVYKARQKSLNRLVALKLLAPERVQDAKFAERFAREAQALALLSHPNIVTVHDFGQAGGFYFLLMEFVDGVNLRQLLRSRKLQPSEALAIVPPVCEALQYAHEHGIVHRDIKPENLLLAKDGRVKIADFGIAKILGTTAAEESAERSDAGTNVDSATQQTTMGTPQYMAPEQREHPQAADHRTDIYSLGVVLYELLTGELPADKFQPPSRKVQVDVRLDEIVLRALEKTPELRYQTAGEFKTQLETISREEQGGKQHSGRSTPFLKAGQAFLTTREKLGTPEGQLFLYQDKCNLVLDERQLAFVEAKQTRVVALASIRDLSLGRFPLAVNPAGLDFISLTYEENGQRHELIFAPCESIFGAPSGFNAFVRQWYEGIRSTVINATGKAPQTTASDELKVSSSPSSFLARMGMMLIPVFLGIALFVLWGQSTGSSINRFAIVLPLIAVVIGLLVPLAMRRESERTGGDGRVGISWHIGIVLFYAGVILGILLIGMIGLRFNRDSAYLLVVGIMAVFSSVAGSVMGNTFSRVERNTERWQQVQARLKGLAIVAWILALPVIGFGGFFLQGLLTEKGGWNPATSEAVIVPLTWIGSILLPFAGLRLKREADGGNDKGSVSPVKSGTAGPAVVAVAFAAACLSGILPMVFHWFATTLAPSVSLEGRERMLWAALVAAILAVVLGFMGRRSKFGMAALTVGLINLFIWVSLYSAGHYQSTLYGRPEPRETPYVSTHSRPPVQEPQGDRGVVQADDAVRDSRVADRPAFTLSKLLIITAVVAFFTLAIVIVVWMTHKYGLKGFLLTAVIGSFTILLVVGMLFFLFWARSVQPAAVVEQAKAVEMETEEKRRWLAASATGAVPEGARLVAVAGLVPGFEREFRWRWRVNKNQPARILFGLLDTDATGTHSNVIARSLKESLPSDDNWGVPKDIVITLFKEGDSTRLVMEDQFVAPQTLRPNTFTTIVNMEAWQNIRAQTLPTVLSELHYQTLWEAEIVRHSADGKIRSPRKLRLVARLEGPEKTERLQIFSEEDPVRQIREMSLPGSADAKGTLPPPLQPLISEQMLQEAREQDKRMKVLVEGGRASGFEALDSEMHLAWAEAMFKGDLREAMQAKRDGVVKKLEIADKMLAAGRMSYAERSKLTRELAEAEAALKQLATERNR